MSASRMGCFGAAAFLLLAPPLSTAAPTPVAPRATPAAVALEHSGPHDDDAGAPVVRYDDDRLTVTATDVPLAQVLAEVARATGAEIRGPVPTGTVTVALDEVALSTALSAILRDRSFMLTYASDGSLRTIDLLGARVASPDGLRIVRGTPLPSASAPRALEEEERQASVLQRPVRASGEVADALGTRAPTAGAVLHLALGGESASVRAASREAVLEAFATDPEVEAAYLSTLTPVANKTLAVMFRDMSRDAAAEELMTALAGRAPSHDLRYKAGAILTELRKLPPR